MKSAEEILELFCTKFKLQIAVTPALKKAVYQIRYKVYCEELQYEPSDRFPDQMETDIYDQQSIFLLLQHQDSQSYAGCVRLVIPQINSISLPFERVCDHQLHTDTVDLSTLPRDSIFEVSRLAVTSEFRKRKGESNTATGIAISHELYKEERRGFPLVPLSLYLGVIGIMLETKLEHLFTMMEPRLARHLRLVGFHFNQIGDLVDYHGKRGPFYIHQNELCQGLHPEYKPLQQLIQTQIQASLSQYGATLPVVLTPKPLKLAS
jgi:N-acyl amino acid synthase of PEP-CTERM/exosortase system